jgi:hypothetical protein
MMMTTMTTTTTMMIMITTMITLKTLIISNADYAEDGTTALDHASSFTLQQYRQISSFSPQKIGTQVGVVTKVTSAVMVSFSTVAYKLNPLALVKVSMLVDLICFMLWVGYLLSFLFSAFYLKS